MAEIQSVTNDCQWGHIRTLNNPEDIISPGMSARDLLLSSLWWNDLPFLQQNTAEPNFVSNHFLALRNIHIIMTLKTFLISFYQ